MNHLPERVGLFAGCEDYPDMVILSVAMQCVAAKCPNCPFSPWNSDIRLHSKPYVDPAVFDKVARETGKHSVWLRISGGGEPMDHPDGMAHMIARAKSYGCRTWMNTNGNPLNPDAARILLDAGHDLTEFSVDAGDEKTYGIVRRGLSWHTLLHNFDTMVNLRERMFPRGAERPRIVVSVIQQDIVKGKLEQIESFWRDRGADHVIKRAFLTWGDQTTVKERHSTTPEPYLHPEQGEACPYPFHRLNVGSDGTIQPCGFDISQQVRIADLNDPGVTIGEVWRGPFMERWRKMHTAGRGGEIDLCSRCPDWRARSWTYNYQHVDRVASASAMAKAADPGLVQIGGST